MITCPQCSGKGIERDYAHPFGIATYKCTLCKGAGNISHPTYERYQQIQRELNSICPVEYFKEQLLEHYAKVEKHLIKVIWWNEKGRLASGLEPVRTVTAILKIGGYPVTREYQIDNLPQEVIDYALMNYNEIESKEKTDA